MIGAFEKGNLMKTLGMDSPVLLQGIRWPCATWEATQVGKEKKFTTRGIFRVHPLKIVSRSLHDGNFSVGVCHCVVCHQGREACRLG